MRNIESFSSGISRVAAGSEEKEREVLESFEDKFKNQEIFEKEKEKTEEELGLIKDINTNMEQFVKQWDVDWLEIKPKNIHFLDESKLSQREKDFLERQKEGGFYAMEGQSIIVFPHKQRSPLILAQHLAHEMFHFNAFSSFTKQREKEIRPRRAGIRMFSDKNKKVFFYDWDEAVITELQKRFDQKYFKDMPYLANDIRFREEFIENLPEKDREEARQEIAFAHIDVVKDDSGEDVYETEVEGYSYYPERMRMQELIDEIYELNKKNFSSPEEVFDFFTRSLFSGRSLELARLIERTFGKGSFREMGEESSKTMEKGKEVKS